ncbi:SpcZ [Streptomyces sp. NPDC050504]|uniref:SpcZ n=1 Tax=Streptomyces sp. NPDC050504 TaxID=3365618 RepID=UPI0037B5C66B
MTRTPAPAETAEDFAARLAAGPGGAAGHREPEWFGQAAATLYGGQGPGAAREWAHRVHAELDRLAGRVPFSVVHDWHAHTVMPALAEAGSGAAGDGADGAGKGALEAVRLLHLRALAGEPVARAEWADALGSALTGVYRDAYPYADSYAASSVSAREYALDNDYTEEKAAEFAQMYAKLNTDANALSFAGAHALANAGALAAAFADADEEALAAAYPFAYVRVCALAVGTVEGRDEEAARQRAAAYEAACGRLAAGLAESLERAAA